MSAHIVYGRYKMDGIIDSRSFVSETVVSGANTVGVSDANSSIAVITAIANNVYVAFSANGTPNVSNTSARFAIPVNTSRVFQISSNTKISVLDF